MAKDAKAASMQPAEPSPAGPSASDGGEEIIPPRARLPLGILIVLSFVLFYFSNPQPPSYFDYTYRIAGELLHGRLGMVELPPSWLNEMVPLGDRYYSVFPLGSVITMLPLAVLGRLGWIENFPGGITASAIAALSTFIFFCLSARFSDSLPRRFLLSLWPVFGTWTWCNLSFNGAWQVALGFAMLGEAAALYFTLISRRPFLAGCFFALAFGNRTEILLTAPLFFYLLLRTEPGTVENLPKLRAWPAQKPEASALKEPWAESLRQQWKNLAWFVAVPFVLGVLTLAYNYARFSSIMDFGYARIPGVLQEPWYAHGIFSFYAIPNNAEKMLWETWRRIDKFPYLLPSTWGGSIFLSSPLLFLLFRWRARDRTLLATSWIAILILVLLLWCHGNPGGWQYSYRYAMVLIPWMFVLLQGNGPAKMSKVELVLLVFSFAINGYATFLFHRTSYLSY